MIKRDQVLAAYAAALDLRVRRQKIEAGGREETSEEQMERLDAIEVHNTLNLQYLAQEAG
ncbi:hypothetical protein HGG70_05175 [Rhodobacteraceae bacterium R_SAG4]|nr:hypothetical protein [Rhodobacteraceae bacterium R_SAG4]